ncbi:MAG: HEPN domain-containing protein [Candidatus Altiarchaeales archaeon HGW-Altiarchaeales-2]|nr:MAG: HEPN domain-containing protein [Candidatus Altiarchaeales archaeon HGW-Altiarchaeales-2]
MEQLETMIRKAERSLASAKRQIEEGDYDFASSRVYYAAFYAMEAILLTENMVFSKHGAVIGAFNQHFIKPGIFPKEFSKLITRIFRERHIGDYEFDLSIGEDEAKEDLEHAERIVKNITSYLTREGFIEYKLGAEEKEENL